MYRIAAAFGAQQPLVAIGRQGIDVAGPYIDRKSAQALDGIYQENAVVTMANLTDFLNRRPISAQKLDKADGQQAGAAAGLVNALQGVRHG